MLRKIYGSGHSLSRQKTANNYHHHFIRFKSSTQESLPQIQYYYSSSLKCVKNQATLTRLHAQIVASGAIKSIYTCNNLLKAYTSIGLISNAHKLFDISPHKNLVSWTILISGFTKRGHIYEAVKLFRDMLVTGLQPNEITISSILPAVANLGFDLIGRSIHGFWVRRGFEHNVIVETCLIDMYSRFGWMDIAQYMFDEMPVKNVVSWNVIISGYANNGLGVEALQRFDMMRLDGCFADYFTFMSLISAASSSRLDKISGVIHGLIVTAGYNNERQIQTGLINMYSSCCLVDEAHGVFCEMPVTDLVAWTLMLDAFSSSQQWSKAIAHFSEMMSLHSMALDSTAFVSILSSCNRSGALLHGRWVHSLVLKQGFSNDVFVGSALIDMYANCGDLDSGKRYFDAVEKKDVACWNAMVKAMGANGNGADALDLLWKMEGLGFCPNEPTLVSVLSACSHAGMVDEGLQIFNQMFERWGIAPSLQHYACIVDLLGRSGRLDEAHLVMNKMPSPPQPEVYGALLSACRVYGNTEMGAEMFQQLLKSGYTDAGHFRSVSNMYASAGNWNGVATANRTLLSKGANKDPGYSSTEQV